MNLKHGNPLRSFGRAFTLIEVTLATGVAGFCLLTLLGLLPVGLTSNQASLEQTMAANITSALVADLRCVQPLGSGTSSRFGLTVPNAGSSAGSTMTAPSAPQIIYLAANGNATSLSAGGAGVPVYRATVGFAPPSTGRTATAVRVLITWPALADSASSGWPQNYCGSYEADTALNRN